MNLGLGAGREVTVIGAGFSGLVSAYALNRAGYKVSIIEASQRAGGLIDTVRLEEGLVETAANALLNSSAVEELFEAVGLDQYGTLGAAKKRYIFKQGRARRWPLSFGGTLKVLWFGFKYLTSKAAVAPKKGESARAWSERVMGAEAGEYLVEAALQGIYAGDPARMSASLIFARMFEPKSAAVLRSAGMSGSLPGGVSSFAPRHTPPHKIKMKRAKLKGSVAPGEGMGQLIAALETFLKKRGVEFRFGQSAELNSEPLHPHVLATSAHAAGSVLQTISETRASILRRIEFSPVTTTTAFFSGTDRKSKGFGVLFPPVEKRKALGVLKNNFIFRNRVKKGFSETWIIGGALDQTRVIGATDEEILERIQSERSASFGRDDEIYASRTTRWPKGIPHYTLELEQEIGRLQGFEKNVILMG
ncbi:MAG: FAD-binding protein, partial [Proteobacteria bacterium]